MNITELVNNDCKSKLSHGKISIKFDYSIVNADENIYRFLGSNSGRPFTAIIHQDDLDGFYECVENLDKGTQYMLAKLCSIDEKYRYVYVIMDKGPNSIDMQLSDVANNYDKYDKFRDNVFKSKKLMNYSHYLYFEYFYENQIVNIFEYINDRSIVHFTKNIEEINEEVLSSKRYTSKQKQEFSVLYESMIEGTDNLSLCVDGSIFGFDKCILEINGGIVYKYGKKQQFAGTVNKVKYDDAETDEKYYRTSHAIDLATGVYNKRAISELAIDILAASENKCRYVIMMDIDDFKDINDTYGHMTGDDVIAKAAEVLKTYVGERGYVGRFGGDEFFVITDKIPDEEGLTYLLKTVRKNMNWDCEKIAPGANVTTSMGIACYPSDGKTYDELLMIADKCLYLAKAKGKNRYIIYRPNLHGDIENVKSSAQFTLNTLFEDNYHMCSVAMSVLSDIRDKNVSVDRCMDRIRQEFAIEAVSVYSGEEYKRILSSGEYTNPIMKAEFFNDNTLNKLIDSNGMLCVNKLLNLKEKWSNAYEKLEEQGNQGLLIVRDSNIIVSYDLLERARKWSDIDKGLLLMIGKAMIERISDS